MNREKLMLLGMAPAGGEGFTSTQLQKLFFILDQGEGSLRKSLGGPYFNYRPGDYGPFSQTLPRVLKALINDGLVVEGKDGLYRLSVRGQVLGELDLLDLSESVHEYIRELCVWVRSLSFSELVASVNGRYPEMAVQSCIQGCGMTGMSMSVRGNPGTRVMGVRIG